MMAYCSHNFCENVTSCFTCIKDVTCKYVMVSVCGKNFTVAIFLDTITVVNVELCMIVVLVVLNNSALPIHTTFSDLGCISLR